MGNPELQCSAFSPLARQFPWKVNREKEDAPFFLMVHWRSGESETNWCRRFVEANGNLAECPKTLFPLEGAFRGHMCEAS